MDYTKNRFVSAMVLLGLLIIMGTLNFSAAQTGICYGMQSDNLPSPSDVVFLCNQYNIRRMRIYDANQSVLQALRGSNIELMLGLPNTDLQNIAATQAQADSWVQTNVRAYPTVRFRYIVVGNEVDPLSSGQYAPFVLPALQNIQNAITRAGLGNQIRVSTSIGTDLLGTTYPPESGAFTPEVTPYINPIITFLVDNRLPLLASIYPYFFYISYPSEIDLPYALFTSPNGIVFPSGVRYQNLFYEILDALYAALEKNNGSSLEVVVSESGWPSAGGDRMNVDNARTYNTNLIQRVRSGTPKRPNRAIETYIFSLFDENLRNPKFERHFGIFTPIGEPKLITFSVESPAGSPVITKNGSRAPPIQSPAHPPQSAGSGGAPAPFQSPSHHPESSGGIDSTTDEPSHNKTRTLGVVLVVTGIVFLTTIGAVCLIKRRCFPTSADQESNYQAVEAFLLQHGSLALKRYKYSEIKKMTKSLSDKLGQGGYGSVYKGKLHDGTLIAVKVLSSIDGNVEDFVNEVASISRTSHVNIVNLLGFCFDRKKRALVYEYMPNKSLDKYISNSGSTGTNCCLDMEILFRIAVGVAEGLDYLHRCCNIRIVHFDIKPQNILLDEEFCPKISDFGLAKLCKKKQSLLSVLGTRGTVGYIAPEVFSRNFGGVSHKSDVYSYGMMVLEMAGANMIAGHTNETTQSIEDYFPDKIYERVHDTTSKLDGFEIEVKEETARKMLLIGFWCIQTNPSDRPSISKVVEMFGGSIESIQTPPKPVLFTPTLPVWGVSSSFSSYVEETQPSAEGVTQTQFKVSVNGSC